MKKLHLVGFTAENEGLILSPRKGAKSGGFMITLDDELVSSIERARRQRLGDDPDDIGGGVGSEAGGWGSRPLRARSSLSPREIQARLRAGSSISEVAGQAGVDDEWVLRFAAPILAEQAQVVERAQGLTLVKSRRGPSIEPLAPSVQWNLSDRGVQFSDDVFADCWSAYNLHGARWAVRFAYTSRKRRQVAEWEVDLRDRSLVARSRLATDLGHVEAGRRRPSIEPSDPGALEAGPPSPSGREARTKPVRALPGSPRSASPAAGPTAKTAVSKRSPAKPTRAGARAAAGPTAGRAREAITTAGKRAPKAAAPKAAVTKAAATKAAATAPVSGAVAVTGLAGGAAAGVAKRGAVGQATAAEKIAATKAAATKVAGKMGSNKVAAPRAAKKVAPAKVAATKVAATKPAPTRVAAKKMGKKMAATKVAVTRAAAKRGARESAPRRARPAKKPTGDKPGGSSLPPGRSVAARPEAYSDRPSHIGRPPSPMKMANRATSYPSQRLTATYARRPPPPQPPVSTPRPAASPPSDPANPQFEPSPAPRREQRTRRTARVPVDEPLGADARPSGADAPSRPAADAPRPQGVIAATTAPSPTPPVPPPIVGLPPRPSAGDVGAPRPAVVILSTPAAPAGVGGGPEGSEGRARLASAERLRASFTAAPGGGAEGPSPTGGAGDSRTRRAPRQPRRAPGT